MTNAKRNQKILAGIDSETKRALTSKAVARNTLIKEGIYTAKGQLRVEFGGKASKKRPATA